jgi:hypothetical protein
MAQALIEVFRAMLEESGSPRLGSSATCLSIRKGIDIEVDANDFVHKPLFVPGKRNGLSCALSIADLPAFALPQHHGGRHAKTHVWKIKVADLGSDLVAQQDGQTHVSIGPAKTMTYNDYVDAIEATRPKWVKVT